MAEAILNKLGEYKFQAYSAGSQPRGRVHPETIRLLQGLDYGTSCFRSKSWSEFARPGAPALDFVFTVCDGGAKPTPTDRGHGGFAWETARPPGRDAGFRHHPSVVLAAHPRGSRQGAYVSRFRCRFATGEVGLRSIVAAVVTYGPSSCGRAHVFSGGNEGADVGIVGGCAQATEAARDFV